MSTSQEPAARTARPIEAREMGRSVVRRDGRAKVTGAATYAAEHAQDALHAVVVQSTIARGRVTAVVSAEALAHPGVVEVLDHTNAVRLEDTSDRELAVLQDDRVGFRGQVVAVKDGKPGALDLRIQGRHLPLKGRQQRAWLQQPA